MKRIALALMLAAPLTASAAPDLFVCHVQNLALAASPTDILPLVIKEVSWTVGTPTFTTPDRRAAKVVCTADTCAAPTTQASGVNIDNWQGFSVTVEADSGKLLTGVGTIDCYTWDTTVGAFSLQQDLGLAVASTCTVRRCTTIGVWVAAPRGYLTCVPTGVITNATGGVTLYINGETRK